ncbi:MAG TPA: alanine racemase [Firmicutes bacterium]|nr:alanine racemase [Bacillota bacterium]
MRTQMNRKILSAYQTPLYVFDMKNLKERIGFLRSRLPEDVSLCYAVKANPFILGRMEKWIDRFEVCSPGELRICQAHQLPVRKLVISGVFKSPELMEELIRAGEQPCAYTVESEEQLEMLKALAEKAGQNIHVLLRLTSGNQFGMDEEVVRRILCGDLTGSRLTVRGIQYFSGTQKKSVRRLQKELDYVDGFIRKLREENGISVPELEFGPGFPVAYFQGEDFDEEEFLKEVSGLMNGLTCGAKLTLELGRSIAASCGSYLTRVVDTKTNKGQNYAILDGGMHQLVYYGQSMAMKQPVYSLFPERTAEDGDVKKWNLCGSLCTINDILAKQLPMADLKKGDVIRFENTGAYCMTEGIALFLSRDLPEIILIDEQEQIVPLRGPVPVYHLNLPEKPAEDRPENGRED